jgi:hypothetical protein
MATRRERSPVAMAAAVRSTRASGANCRVTARKAMIEASTVVTRPEVKMISVDSCTDSFTVFRRDAMARYPSPLANGKMRTRQPWLEGAVPGTSKPELSRSVIRSGVSPSNSGTSAASEDWFSATMEAPRSRIAA